MGDPEPTVRHARPDDHGAVAEFTGRIWTDRGGDYLADVYHDWIADDGDDQRTFVIETANEGVVGIAQGVMLTDTEAWAKGMRIDPEAQDRGLGGRLNDAVFSWAAERGAVVCRNMVFSWNEQGLAAARAMGYDPVTEFRWAHPTPDRDAAPGSTGGDLSAVGGREAVDAGWTCWSGSEARDSLRGLALDRNEAWSVSELTRADLGHAAEEASVLAVRSHGRSGGTRGLAHRVRDYERESDGTAERWVEYGLATWADLPAARALFAAVARDAAAFGADRARVLIPETPRHVSDAARARASPSDEPMFVFGADLSGRGHRRGG